MDEEQTQGDSDAQYVFVKLANGDNIMCTTFSDLTNVQKLKFLEVIDPIQIFSFKIPNNGVIIEKFIFQAWTPFSKATSTNIPMNNVVFVGELKEYFIERYIEYITDPNGQQVLEETGPEVMEDNSEEASDEMIEEFIQENNETKKWYH